jgi:dipeptidyl aminopeptidase/acylaminoacyl peptidase
MVHLNDGVGAAVDQAVAVGIADSTRLGLLGHSYGGYSVFGLLTLTRRFKAAVAIAGLSDLVSMYGSLDSRYSRMEPNYAANVGPWYLEKYQGRMGAPPWADPEHYVRNSPIFYANRVTTPLLIMVGDVDYLPSQSEEFFTALYRQNKRVEFVRYLGESHVFQSPANVADMWRRIFSWFDTYVLPESWPPGAVGAAPVSRP